MKAPLIAGRYVFGPRIAAGGMASVHLGQLKGEAGFSRTVAIKRLLPAFVDDPELVAMLVDEARLSSRIRHANVVPTLDVVKSPEELFVIMEYAHGEPFSRVWAEAKAKGARLDPHVVATVWLDVLAGLHALHEATDQDGAPLLAVHRDVSPHNVLVGADGVSMLLDFGIAKARGRMQITRTGEVKGKLGYLAPEQLVQEADRRTDLFAVGVCLWEGLTMQRLFAQDSEQDVIDAILACRVPAPSTASDLVSPAVDAVVMRALAREPSDRYATAREMAEALSDALSPAPTVVVTQALFGLLGPSLERKSQLLRALESGEPEEDAAPTSTEPINRARRFVSLVSADEVAEGDADEEATRRSLAPGAAASGASGKATDGAVSSGSGSTAAPGSTPTHLRIITALSLLVAAGVLVYHCATGARDDARTAGTAAVATEPAPALPSTALGSAAREYAAPPPSAAGSLTAAASASQARAPVGPPTHDTRPGRPRGASSGRKGVDCSVPFAIDADGIRRYRKECVSTP